MPREIIIARQGLPGLAEPLEPDALRGLHPLWAADVDALGPWGQADFCGAAALACPCGGEGAGPVLVCGECASTQDVARELAARGQLPVFGSVVAPAQKAGRGQLRRQWLSQPGNLLATVLCPPAQGPWNDLRPLLLGYLLAEALSALGEAVSVKWPNDLLCRGRKVAGMLVEERGDVVLAGLGLNLAWAPPEELLREGHAISAGEFHPSDRTLGPLRLWLALVKHMETGYMSLLDTFSPSEFLALFRSRLAWTGRRVLVSEGVNRSYEAIVRGVSEEGGLVLSRAGVEVVLLAGDVIPL